jgi:A/G-specific adenine glycosylase
MQSWIQSHLGLKAAYIKPMTETRHAFTSYQVKLLPFHFSCKKPLPMDEFKWLSLPELHKVAFPSGHRRIFMQLQSSCE